MKIANSRCTSGDITISVSNAKFVRVALANWWQFSAFSKSSCILAKTEIMYPKNVSVKVAIDVK